MCIHFKQFENRHFFKLSKKVNSPAVISFIYFQYSLAMGLQGKNLGPIYYSLSQTYKDNGQYELALDYSLKEYEFSKNNPEEVRILNFLDKSY